MEHFNFRTNFRGQLLCLGSNDWVTEGKESQCLLYYIITVTVTVTVSPLFLF